MICGAGTSGGNIAKMYNASNNQTAMYCNGYEKDAHTRKDTNPLKTSLLFSFSAFTIFHKANKRNERTII